MYTNSITVDQVIDALADFVEPFAVGAVIVRAQTNRVPMPDGPCVVLTELLTVDIDAPYTTYRADDDQADITGRTRIDVQIDFYGDLAGEWSRAVQSAFRTAWGFDQFPATVKPLYTSDGVQMPFITGEHQYLSRWMLTASMQYNPVVAVPQQFADAAAVDIFEAVDLNP